MRKRKTKSKNIHSQIRKLLPGFRLEFDMEDPIGDHNKPLKTKVYHRNPVMQVKIAQDHFWHVLCRLLNIHPCKWKITITMAFKKDGKIEMKAREIVGVSTLPKLDDIYQSTIENMFEDAQKKNYLDQYERTYVRQEIINGLNIEEKDFEQKLA